MPTLGCCEEHRRVGEVLALGHEQGPSKREGAASVPALWFPARAVSGGPGFRFPSAKPLRPVRFVRLAPLLASVTAQPRGTAHAGWRETGCPGREQSSAPFCSEDTGAAPHPSAPARAWATHSEGWVPGARSGRPGAGPEPPRTPLPGAP